MKSYSKTNIKVMQQFKITSLPLHVYATRKFRIWINYSKYNSEVLDFNYLTNTTNKAYPVGR